MTDKDDTETKNTAQGHTPGPWTFETESGDWPDNALIGGDGESVMWWDFDLGFRFNSAADARLIAVAPDMLEALREIERTLLRVMDDPSRADEIPAVIAARAAIAKAEGKDQ